MAVLSDRIFLQYCNLLKVPNQIPSDPDKRQIEKAFRKMALKTHPDKPGGNAVDFRRINDAYTRLMNHVSRLEAIEAEAQISQISVVIEISKQAVPMWADKLRMTYGKPKTSNIKNAIFEGPCKQYKGRGGNTGPITLVLYEDPEDNVPKIHCRCDNYMAWIQEQKLPLHLHVQKNKKIMFDQWRIMSMAEFGFCKMTQGMSARHAWQQTNSARSKENDEEMREMEKQRKQEEEERRNREKEQEEENRKKQMEEMERIKKASENVPFWSRIRDRYGDFRIGETTPPPEDLFPKIYNVASSCYTAGGVSEEDIENNGANVKNYVDEDGENNQSCGNVKKETLRRKSVFDKGEDLENEEEDCGEKPRKRPFQDLTTGSVNTDDRQTGSSGI